MPEMTCPKCGTKMISADDIKKLQQIQSFMNVYVTSENGENARIIQSNADKITLPSGEVVTKESVYKAEVAEKAKSEAKAKLTGTVISPIKPS